MGRREYLNYVKPEKTGDFHTDWEADRKAVSDASNEISRRVKDKYEYFKRDKLPSYIISDVHDLLFEGKILTEENEDAIRTLIYFATIKATGFDPKDVDWDTNGEFLGITITSAANDFYMDVYASSYGYGQVEAIRSDGVHIIATGADKKPVLIDTIDFDDFFHMSSDDFLGYADTILSQGIKKFVDENRSQVSYMKRYGYSSLEEMAFELGEDSSEVAGMIKNGLISHFPTEEEVDEAIRKASGESSETHDTKEMTESTQPLQETLNLAKRVLAFEIEENDMLMEANLNESGISSEAINWESIQMAVSEFEDKFKRVIEDETSHIAIEEFHDDDGGKFTYWLNDKDDPADSFIEDFKESAYDTDENYEEGKVRYILENVSEFFPQHVWTEISDELESRYGEEAVIAVESCRISMIF